MEEDCIFNLDTNRLDGYTYCLTNYALFFFICVPIIGMEYITDNTNGDWHFR